MYIYIYIQTYVHIYIYTYLYLYMYIYYLQPHPPKVRKNLQRLVGPGLCYGGYPLHARWRSFRALEPLNTEPETSRRR